jgi:hypothetical protein
MVVWLRGFVFFSLCYVALRWVLQLAVLRVRSKDVKDREAKRKDRSEWCGASSERSAPALIGLGRG